MIYIFVIAILVAIDQMTKVWAREYLSTIETLPVIENFFHLTYVENRGAAFGMLQGGAYFFAIVSIVIIVALIVYLKKSNSPKIQWYICSMIVAGAIGNLIDRLTLRFVTDMIDFRGIWQWVFNFADMYVVVGTILFLLAILIEERNISLKEVQKSSQEESKTQEID